MWNVTLIKRPFYSYSYIMYLVIIINTILEIEINLFQDLPETTVVSEASWLGITDKINIVIHNLTIKCRIPLDAILVHSRVTICIKFATTQLYTWVERGTVRVKCFLQEHNKTSPARARTWTTQSRSEHTNHEATASPHMGHSPVLPN